MQQISGLRYKVLVQFYAMLCILKFYAIWALKFLCNTNFECFRDSIDSSTCDIFPQKLYSIISQTNNLHHQYKKLF